LDRSQAGHDFPAQRCGTGNQEDRLRASATRANDHSGEAKGEFSKHIQAKKVRGLAVELQTADKMTERQLAARVKRHFVTVTAKKPKVSKQAAQPTPRKHAKKTGK
jgi:hypothetical protein